jgi:plastocyanin
MKYLMTLFFAIGSLNAAEVKITQKNKAFDKTEVTINEGDTISFYNDETDITHNVYSLGPVNEFELKAQTPKSTTPVTFAKAGTTEVECAIHPNMKLKVIVKGK